MAGSTGDSGHRDGWKIWGGALVLTVVGFVVAWQFVEPAPPRHLSIATGAPDGAYHAFGERIAAAMERVGFDVELRSSRGSLENIELLSTREVDVAFVQGGTLPDPAPQELVGLGSLYYEPLWLFARAAVAVEDLRDLAGRSIVVGAEGSGTREVACALLDANGLAAGQWTEAPTEQDADAVFVVGAPSSGRVAAFMAEEGAAWRLVDVRRHAAYEARFGELQMVVLSEGMFDLGRNVPDRSVRLLAPTAQLVAQDGLHPALAPLLIEVAQEIFGPGGLFEEAGEFPSPVGLDVPVAPEAAHYYQHGRSFLFRVFPFWLAALLDRIKILLLPLLTLLLPLAKIAPPLYRWRIRSKIYRWYAVLRDVEKRARGGESGDADDDRLQEMLAEVEAEIRDVDVPPSYMEELYNLRMHLDRMHETLVSGRQSS